MVYRDPRSAQRLISQGEEEAAITEMLGPRPNPGGYQPPGPGMIPGNPSKPFRFNDPVPGQDPIRPAFQPTKPSVTTITPDRQTPFSRSDAQALAALDPRALDDANALAARPESMPRMITGKNETTGESFQMQPTARVDRNALAKLYAGAQERKGQERQDSVRGQEQAGKERLVGIPGQQLNERDKYRVDSEERVTGKKLEADAPGRAADIAGKNAQTAAVTGGEARAQAGAARQPNQEKLALIEKVLEAKRSSPFATTSQGRSDIAAVEKMLASMSGVDLPPAPAQNGGGINIAGVDAVMADPGVEDLMKKIEGSAQGTMLNSPGNRQEQNLHIQTLNRRLQALAQAQGIDISEIAPQIKARLAKSINKRSFGQSLGEMPGLRQIDALLGVERASPPAALVGE